MVHILEGMQTTGSWRMHVVIDEIESKSTTRCRDKSKGMYAYMYIRMYNSNYIIIELHSSGCPCFKDVCRKQKKTSVNTHKLF